MLLVTRTSLNVESLMGAIMAVGIAASNSILLVHFANERRLEDDGVGPVDAARRTRDSTRLPARAHDGAGDDPLGMTPIAPGLGEAGQQNAPLCPRRHRQGCSSSTLATLVVILRAYAVPVQEGARDAQARSRRRRGRGIRERATGGRRETTPGLRARTCREHHA